MAVDRVRFPHEAFADIKKLWGLSEPQERRRLTWLLLGMLCLGVLEVVGVSSVLPFIAVLASPEIVRTSHVLSELQRMSGFSSIQHFLVFLGALALLFTIVANSFGLFINWKIVQIANRLGHGLSLRILRRYVSQPYTFYLSRVSTNLGLNTSDEVAGVVNGVMVPTLQLTSRLVVAAFLTLLVIVADPSLAVIFVGVFGGAYVIAFRFVRRRLFGVGQEYQTANRARFRTAMTLFQGIKELRVLGRIDHSLEVFERASQQVARTQSLSSVLVLIPRYAIETIAVVGMLSVALYLFMRDQNLGRTLPLLTLYAFAAYRLMPALQNIFASLSQIRFNLPSLHLLYEEMQSTSPFEPSDAPAKDGAAADIDFERVIELTDVHFAYPGSETPVLKGLSLAIPRNSTIGIVGTSGAGKTTIVDLILALLAPMRGKVSVDGMVIDSLRAPAWRAKVGYVPQVVYLSEESVARNIAFGLQPEKIDMERVREAARIANIHRFIEEELPQGYETPIGERGIRLSGGQRQRLGIARALYSDPEVLILDEATSSLDSITEDAVIDAIHQLSHRKTIIAVAHRLTTLQDCDLIYMLSFGQVADVGTFNQLLARNDTFRAMAKVS